MLSFDSRVVNALLAIEQECADLHTQGHRVGADTSLLRRAARSRSHVGRVLSDYDAALKSLQTLVRSLDRDSVACDPGESLAEVAARADICAILLQLEQIGGHLGGIAAQERTRVLFVGRFRSFHDVSWFVIDGLGAVNEQWLRYRRLTRCTVISSACDGLEAQERRALLHCASREPQQSMVALWSDPDFTAFLTAGMALDWPGVSEPCRQIDRIVRAQAERELDARRVDAEAKMCASFCGVASGAGSSAPGLPDANPA